MTKRPITRAAVAVLLAAVAGVVALVTTTAASAATTRPAQLALTGVVTPQHPTGGSVVGANPGDTVNFTAATVPTVGLDQLGLSVGSLTGGVLSTLSGYTVKITFGSNTPGGARTVVVGPGGACGGRSSYPIAYPKVGNYGFTWTALSVRPLGGLLGGSACQPVNLDGNALKSKGVALNAANQYVGQVAVSTAPPSTGIGIQLPSAGAQPSITGVGNLPSIGVPGTTINGPTLPNLPTLPTAAPSSSKKTTAPASHSGGATLNFTRVPMPIAASVVPTGYGCCYVAPGGGYAGQNAGAQAISGGGSGAVPGSVSSKHPYGVNSAGQTLDAAGQPVDLAAGRTSGTSTPLILAVLAIAAFALVALAYGRRYLAGRGH